MTARTTTFTAVLLTGICIAAIGPAAAQDAPPAPPAGAPAVEQPEGPEIRQPRMGGKGLRHRAILNRGGGPLNLVCSPRGAERLEHRFVSLSHRVALTAEQQPLFEALRTAALTAQTAFADQCAELLPAPAAGEPAVAPDLVERTRAAIALGEARVAGLNEVLPELEAFYGSLTDEQKTALETPRRRMGEGGDRRRPGFRHRFHDDDDRRGFFLFRHGG